MGESIASNRERKGRCNLIEELVQRNHIIIRI